MGGNLHAPRGGSLSIDMAAAQAHLAATLETHGEAVVRSWTALAGADQLARYPDLEHYLRSLVAGLRDVFASDNWTVTQAIVDALAARRARSSESEEQGVQRTLLFGRTAVRPYLEADRAEACDELLLDALHECLFRFFESYQGLRLASETERLHSRIIKSLVMALEARDPYTKGHSISVALMTQKIAEALGLKIDPSRAYLSGLLHDVGKVGIPDRILLKETELDDREWRVMHAHPRMGASILTPIRLFPDVVGAVLSHHENHDGSGYPYGLSDEEIPPIARIIRVVDSFDAMTSARAYRSSRSVDYAMEEIETLSGTLYDPDVAAAFREVVETPGIVRELSLASLQIDLNDFTLSNEGVT